jgi:hypothetical protein
MTKVRVKSAPTARKAMRAIAHSESVSAFLKPVADAVHAQAAQDPNPRYVAALRVLEHHSSGAFGRVSWRVGCLIPSLGARVEAKRGTLARAMGAAGA